jgi:integrase/recombinase XerD
MKLETNLSNNYRCAVILIVGIFSRFSNKPFKSITRKDVTLFLDSILKPEDIDPLHKSIGTYNYYLVILTRFFKWLYNPTMPSKTRPKPAVVENITSLKQLETSIYNPSDLWTEQDDLIFLKYCPSKRMKAYHTVSRDSSCRPHEILKLKVKDIMFKTSGNYQYAEVRVNGKTGSRHIPLINSIPFVKDYLDHEHPQPNNQNAPFICGIGRASLGKHLRPISLTNMYSTLYKKSYFPKLLTNPNVIPEDKQKIKKLLNKPWNPYIRRHTALTEKSLNPKIAHILNQHAGWTQGSAMREKYLHYFSNTSSESILEAYGIVPTDKKQSDILKPRICPNCNEGNIPNSKFCAKCRMILKYDQYTETLESENKKETRITTLEKELKELTDSHDILVQMYEADPQERRKLKQLYREARDNGARIPGQMLFLPKEEYTPGSFSHTSYDLNVQDQEDKIRERKKQ